jgi:hypothetical protein
MGLKSAESPILMRTQLLVRRNFLPNSQYASYRLNWSPVAPSLPISQQTALQEQISVQNSLFRQGLPILTQLFFMEHPILPSQPEVCADRHPLVGVVPWGQFRLLRWKVVMSVLNLIKRLVAIVALVAISPTVMGQVYHPFAEPLEFNPDWQFFAPVDIDSLMELPSRKRANTGWFATYDRTYQWVSRPNVEQSRADGDFAWGNRYDLGFMTEERNGWLFSLRHIGGPNAYHNIYQERIDRYNPDDTGPTDPTPVQPFIDRNDPNLGTRAYILGDSVNVAGLSNFEINKTWRREPYRYGGIIEPMVGLRFSNFKDFALNQTYFRSTGLISEPGGTTTTTDVETLISNETNIANKMFGGQLGFRYFNYYKRWTLSSDFRAFGCHNVQTRAYRQRTFTTEYDGIGIGSDTVATDFTSGTAFIDTSNSEFVVGFEVRAEAAYQVTKYLSIRGGIDFIDFATGIWRGQNPGFGEVNNHSQDVQIAGFSGGITLNR